MTNSCPDTSRTPQPPLSELESLPQEARRVALFLILHSDFVEEITSGSTMTEAQLDEMRNTALARGDSMLYALLSYCKTQYKANE